MGRHETYMSVVRTERKGTSVVSHWEQRVECPTPRGASAYRLIPLSRAVIIAEGVLRGTPTLRCRNHAGMATGAAHRDDFPVSLW